jgi:HAD superfamily hydrolase (TIGR01509 family)
MAAAIRALIFDVDGTLAETEEAHRQAFNSVFAREGLGWVWDVERYRHLLRVTGGKERIARYLADEGLSLPPERIAALHGLKNEAYMRIVRSGGAPLRPGIAELIADARAAGLKLAICTTTSRVNIETLLDVALGAQGRALFAVVVTGEDVRAKKPDPEAYLLALARLQLPASQCLALEDSRNGVEAAVAAGVRVVVSPSLYTSHETFPGAAAIRDEWRGFDWRQLTDGAAE